MVVSVALSFKTGGVFHKGPAPCLLCDLLIGQGEVGGTGESVPLVTIAAVSRGRGGGCDLIKKQTNANQR